MAQFLDLSYDGGIAILRLARPPVNAINLDLAEEAAALLTDLERDGAVRAVVFTGTGRTFSGGLDLKEVPTYDAVSQRRMVELLNRLFYGIYAFKKPVVAAVNGHAVAGGLVLALACDYRVGTTAPARIGLTEVKVGVPYPATAMAIVRGELSMGAARHLVLGSENESAQAALRHGIFDELCAPAEVMPRALAVAKVRAELPSLAFALTKRSLRSAALAEMKEAAQGRDPVKHEWLSAQTIAASTALLTKEGG